MPGPVYNVAVKWGKETFSEVALDTSETPAVFKLQIWTLTGVPPERQTVLGLRGGKLKDDADWTACGVRDGMKIMVIGTREGAGLKAPPADVKVRDDLDSEIAEEEMVVGGVKVPPGLANLGNTCYMNATVQCLNACPPLTDALGGYRGTSSAMNPAEKITASLRDVVGRLKAGASPSVNPMGFLSMLRQVNPQFAERGQQGFYMQQDAEECWGEILSRLATALTVDGASKIDELFAITTKVNDVCEEGDTGESVERSDSVRALKCHISLAVNHLSQGIKEGLEETIEKQSEALGRSASWRRTSRLDKIPPFLIVQFVRFFWKPSERVKAKILRNVSFPLQLDVYDFCTEELQSTLRVKRDAALAAADAAIALKNAPDTAPAAGSASGVGSVAAASATIDASNRPAENASPLAAEIGNYELSAVLTHRGRAADAGHYVAWVKDVGSRWFKFDDDKVSIHTEEEVQKLSGGGDWHMAYMCLYRAKNNFD